MCAYVVIAILGLLAALAIPRLTGSRDNANRKTVLADLRTIESALSIAQAEGKTVTAIGPVDTATSLIALGYLASEPQGPENVSYTLGGTPLRAQAIIAEGVTDIFGTTTDTGTYTIDQLLTAGW